MNQDLNQTRGNTLGSSSAPAANNRPTSRRQPLRLAIGVHSMPKTSAGNLKLWFVLGGVILALFVVIIFLALN